MRTTDSAIDLKAFDAQLMMRYQPTVQDPIMRIRANYSPELAREWSTYPTRSIEHVTRLLDPAEAKDLFSMITRSCAYQNDDRIAIHLNTARYVLRARAKKQIA